MAVKKPIVGYADKHDEMLPTDTLDPTSLPVATTTVLGIAELATDAEAIAGTATDVVLTPSNLAAYIAANPSGAGDTTRTYQINAGQVNTPPGSVPRTQIGIGSGTGDAEFLSINPTDDTVTVAAHSGDVTVELFVNAAFLRLTGSTEIDAGVIMRSTLALTDRNFIYAQGRAGGNYVQCTGSNKFTITSGDVDRTFGLYAVTQADGNWQLVGPFGSGPGIGITVTKHN